MVPQHTDQWSAVAPLAPYKASKCTVVSSLTAATNVVTLQSNTKYVRIFAYTADVVIQFTNWTGDVSLAADDSDDYIAAGFFVDKIEVETFANKLYTTISAMAVSGTASMRIYEYTW